MYNKPRISHYLFLIFMIGTLTVQAENEIKINIYSEATENGYDIFADNEEYCPVSIKIQFANKNLSINKDDRNRVFVLKPQEKRQLLTSATFIQKNVSTYLKFETKVQIGDHNLKNWDKEYVYDLPFPKDHTYLLSQGYFGKFSHSMYNALDFTMPEGSPITAMREGLVIRVVKNHSRGCKMASCKKYNNYLLVYHEDGTIAEYVHFRKNGTDLDVGDRVEKGQVIAYSGDTGFSSGPHLHVSVFVPRIENRESLKTKFRIDDGSKAIYLAEGKKYTRNY